MKKCIRLTFGAHVPEGFLSTVILAQARSHELEGSAQHVVAESIIRVIACGDKDNIDDFLDSVLKELAKKKIDDYEIEPFVKDREYRGVFRIIE